jgi:hypothetical protein
MSRLTERDRRFLRGIGVLLVFGICAIGYGLLAGGGTARTTATASPPAGAPALSDSRVLAEAHVPPGREALADRKPPADRAKPAHSRTPLKSRTPANSSTPIAPTTSVDIRSSVDETPTAVSGHPATTDRWPDRPGPTMSRGRDRATVTPSPTATNAARDGDAEPTTEPSKPEPSKPEPSKPEPSTPAPSTPAPDTEWPDALDLVLNDAAPPWPTPREPSRSDRTCEPIRQ